MKTGGAVCILWDLITTQQPSWASCSLPIYRYGPESPLHHCSAAAACTHARMHGCKLMQLQDTRSETGSTWTCPRCIRADVIRRKNTGSQSLAGEGVGGGPVQAVTVQTETGGIQWSDHGLSVRPASLFHLWVPLSPHGSMKRMRGGWSVCTAARTPSLHPTHPVRATMPMDANGDPIHVSEWSAERK